MGNIGEQILEKLKDRFAEDGILSILFCPYKEDMWDSMKTIYDSAVKDSNVITEVMPIPYFTLKDLMPNTIEHEFPRFVGSFPDALNYSWDVILIHYPYDARNSITRPLLTSVMLKCFCKHLVFLPYAVPTDEHLTREQVVLPAIINSEIAIYRNARYANEASEFLKEVGAETECVGWGSPKFDLLDDKTNIPIEWEEKVRGKKIILFQTSIIPYMSNPNRLDIIEAELIKLMEREDVCVWWRPHPLYKQTILARRPYELPRFNKMEYNVSKEHIVDVSSDLHRAIAWSDELVSDKSSVVELYKETGKPIRMMEE